LVLSIFILRPFYSQKSSKAISMCYNPSALWDSKTASSAKARKNTYKVAISKIYRSCAATLCSLKYLSKYGYT
jgi:hypothetical protein